MRHTHRARSHQLGHRANDRRGIQIGPRIRIGGSVGKLGQKAKLATGKVLSNKIVQGVVGATLGPWAAAAAGGLGKALDTSEGRVGLSDLAKGTAVGGVSGLAGMGVKNIGKSLLSKGVGAIGTGGGGGVTDAVTSDPSRFRSVGGFLKDNARTIADYGKLGEGIYDRYQENQDRNRADQEYASARPLRDAAMAGLLDTSRPDVSSVFADPMNPQGRYRTVSVGSRGRY